MSYEKPPIPWPDKPVYQISVEGVKAALMPDGRVMGWTTGYRSPEEVCRLTHADTGNPWIPKHRNFNSLVKQMFREDDFDDLLKFRRERKQRQQNMKAAAEDMYEALSAVNKLVAEAAANGFNCHDGDWAERLFHSQQATSSALKKAKGGRS